MIKLDHLNLYVADVNKSRAFYESFLPPSGLPVNRDFGEVAVGFGDRNYAAFVRDPDGHNLEFVCHNAPHQ